MSSSLTINPNLLSNTPGITYASNSTAGCVGEVISSVQSTAVGSAFTLSQWSNITSLTLTPGDWDVRGIVNLAVLALVTDVQLAVSTYSGNTTTDHVVGDNVVGVCIGVGASSAVLPATRFNVSVSTVVYLKGRLVGAVGNALTGKLSARRIR